MTTHPKNNPVTNLCRPPEPGNDDVVRAAWWIPPTDEQPPVGARIGRKNSGLRAPRRPVREIEVDQPQLHRLQSRL